MDLKTICAKGMKRANRFRVGRGIGSGNGKTCGKGHKGLNARSGGSRRAGYEGGQMPIYRQIPKRGFTNARFSTAYTIINVGALSELEEGSTVDLAGILSHGLTSRTGDQLKVLGNGDPKKRLIVRAQKFSASARAKIEAAGGQVVELDKLGREAAAGTAS